MSLIEFDLEYRKLIEQSLDGNQVAERLQVSPSRVRQLALPANPGLYSFLSRADKPNRSFRDNFSLVITEFGKKQQY